MSTKNTQFDVILNEASHTAVILSEAQRSRRTRANSVRANRCKATTSRVPQVREADLGILITLVLALFLTPFLHAQDQQDQSQAFTLKVNSDLVLTNVVVRDKKTGQVVKGLSQKDFTITENGKPQQIVSFDFESVDEAAALNEATISGKSGNSILLGKSPVMTGDAL